MNNNEPILQITASESSNAEIDTIPHHLVAAHLLPVLDAKTITRFKTVSTENLSTICTPEFTKTHLKFSSSRHHFILLKPDGHFVLPQFEEQCKSDALLGVNFRKNEEDKLPILVGSCDGLICSLFVKDEEKSGYFVVWNPATGQFRDIPFPGGDVVCAIAEGYGFGYLPTPDDYHIVATFRGERYNHCGVYVFSLRDGNWVRIDCTCDQESLVLAPHKRAVVIGSTMYWPPAYPSLLDWGKHVVGFNTVTQKFSMFPVVDDLSHPGVNLFRSGVCLVARRIINQSDSHFWMLKNPDEGPNDWEELLSIDVSNINFLSFSHSGKCLVLHSNHFKLVDMKVEALSHVREVVGSDSCVDTLDYVESLISPFLCAQPNEKKIIERKMMVV